MTHPTERILTDRLDNTPENTREFGRVFGTPLVISGSTWIPLTELIVWPILAWVTRRRNPNLNTNQAMVEGALMTIIVLGSEWCHNMAHVLAAYLIDKPMDQLRILFGMPRCVYHDLNDPDVQPKEHVIRALGGPLMNALLLPVALLARVRSTAGSRARRLATLAVWTNLFLCTVGLLPIPYIDGGPILKWSLVTRGHSVEEADQSVRRVNGPLALITGLIAGAAFWKRKPIIGLVAEAFSLSCLGVFLGWIREEKLPW